MDFAPFRFFYAEKSAIRSAKFPLKKKAAPSLGTHYALRARAQLPSVFAYPAAEKFFITHKEYAASFMPVVNVPMP